jgi:hypothetical protein
MSSLRGVVAAGVVLYVAAPTTSAQMPKVGLASGDVNGDGYDDVVVSDRFAGGGLGGGELHVVDGRSGALLWKRAGFAVRHTDLLGVSIVDEGVDRPVVIAGVRDRATCGLRIEVLRGGDGGELANHALPPTWEEFSCGLAPLDDVDGDGVIDLVVTRPWYSSRADREGRVSILSLVTGCESVAFDGASEGRLLGQALAVGRFDAVPGNDVAVCAWSYEPARIPVSRRSVLTLSGITFTPISEQVPERSFVVFEPSLVQYGDSNGDGLDELLVGALRTLDCEAGEFVAEGRVLSGSSSGALRLVSAPRANDDAVLVEALRGVEVGQRFVALGTPREFACGAGAWRVFDANGRVVRARSDSKRDYYPIAMIAVDIRRDPPSRLVVAGARLPDDVDHYLVDLECWGGPAWTTCLWRYELEPRGR